jgi:hypothetical protein
LRAGGLRSDLRLKGILFGNLSRRCIILRRACISIRLHPEGSSQYCQNKRDRSHGCDETVTRPKTIRGLCLLYRASALCFGQFLRRFKLT